MTRSPFLRQVLILEHDPVGHLIDGVGRGLVKNASPSRAASRGRLLGLLLAVGLVNAGSR